ncbi:hypothetical protein BJ912DRAFT_1044153 [Pholiota molesta]|nr:hypothetical protein BJ912DRAFT_1044153 [Pholiota molesta]
MTKIYSSSGHDMRQTSCMPERDIWIAIQRILGNPGRFKGLSKTGLRWAGRRFNHGPQFQQFRSKTHFLLDNLNHLLEEVRTLMAKETRKDFWSAYEVTNSCST